MDTHISRAQQADLLRRQARRDQIERLVRDAQHLGPSDRALVEQVYDQGQTPAALARLLNVPPRTVQRRLHRVLRRMRRPEFQLVAHADRLIEPDARPVARRVICQGWSMRRAADDLGLSLHAVRQHLAGVRSIARLRSNHIELSPAMSISAA